VVNSPLPSFAFFLEAGLLLRGFPICDPVDEVIGGGPEGGLGVNFPAGDEALWFHNLLAGVGGVGL